MQRYAHLRSLPVENDFDELEKLGATYSGRMSEDGLSIAGEWRQSGQVMTASALLTKTPKPTDAQIHDAMNGNICRCGTYGRIQDAVRDAATSLEGRS